MTATPTRLAVLPRPTPVPGWSLDADRLAAASRLMDGLAHDLRNPLNALALNVEVLHEKLARASGGEVPAGAAKNLQALRDQVARLDGLLGQFGRFLTPPGALPGGVVLGTLVREVSTVLGHAARRAQVTLDLEVPDGDRIQAPDTSLARFLVLRTVLRGIDRTPQGGRLKLSVGREGGRPVLKVEGDTGREVAPGPLEEGLAALARTQLAELHHAGPLSRLVFTGA
jgi:signal transduction histidine kinase